VRTLVLDTNIVLDLFVFDDARVRHVHEALTQGQARWIATASMRDELERVLAYPNIVTQMAMRDVCGEQVLSRFDAGASICETAQAAAARCADEDDQKFIDLAVAHGASLLSKDAAVLALKKKLAALGVQVAPA
jgi:putative PIN family toxin of toxin-antitoxin system